MFDENINTILGKLERLDNPEHDHQERKSLETNRRAVKQGFRVATVVKQNGEVKLPV